jgi:ABC-type Zn2+ transport system substrate-binding protein/surface adhesin
MKTLFSLCLLASLLLWSGCGSKKDDHHGHEHGGHDHGHDHHGHDHGGHSHEAPHGGTLIVLGDELAHVEFVLAADSGELTAYILDRDAKNGVRLAQPDLKLKITRGFKEFELTLAAVASALTGETVGDTSVFAGQHDELKGATDFEVTIAAIQVKGIDFADTAFPFPEGNEQDHHHHDH